MQQACQHHRRKVVLDFSQSSSSSPAIFEQCTICGAVRELRNPGSERQEQPTPDFFISPELAPRQP